MATPNIILILSDDQGWTDNSMMEHEGTETPNIDRLAEEGLCITHGYTTAPLCRSALASIATGLYVYQYGILGNDPVFDPAGFKKYGPEWMARRSMYNQRFVD